MHSCNVNVPIKVTVVVVAINAGKIMFLPEQQASLPRFNLFYQVTKFILYIRKCYIIWTLRCMFDAWYYYLGKRNGYQYISSHRQIHTLNIYNLHWMEINKQMFYYQCKVIYTKESPNYDLCVIIEMSLKSLGGEVEK